MHPPALRREGLRLGRIGLPPGKIAQQLGVPDATVRYWLRTAASTSSGCWRCEDSQLPESLSETYGYLLGLYLGDGCISRGPHGQAVLRIACANAWPGLLDAASAAMASLSPNRVFRIAKDGCTSVEGYWKHWLCVIPQHAPGKKHERSIVLADWQREMIEVNPRPLLRGLFHSDGCRCVNRVKAAGKTYEYPRYFFSNVSADIMAICQWALDLQGVAWRMNNGHSLSVAKAPNVATLDSFIGPKS
jgi:hypothetical protein